MAASTCLVNLAYHGPTFDLLGEPPAPAPGAASAVREREAAAGLRFPAAVREWYLLDPTAERLAAFSNDDRPTTLADLGERVHGPFLREPALADEFPDPPDEGLRLMVENQDVCEWVVALDGSPDPPVYTSTGRPGARGPWVPHTRSFSAFVFANLWFWQFNRPEGRHAGLILFAPFDQEHRARLEGRFTALPRSYHSYGEITVHRFDQAGHAERASVFEEHPAPAWGHCWWLQAASEGALLRLVETVGPLLAGSQVDHWWGLGDATMPSLGALGLRL